jgi:HK97 gp10 family phage protein
MARLATVKVKGLKPLLKRLKALPPRVQRKVLRPAVTKAATPVVKAARQNAPAGTGLTPDGRERLPLKKAITKTRAKLGKKTGTVYVVVGPKKHAAPHSHLVHDGTAPHDITLSVPLVLQNTVLPAGFTIHHPGAAPDPFLANAIDATAGQAQQVLRREVGKGIEKEARKLAKQGGSA